MLHGHGKGAKTHVALAAVNPSPSDQMSVQGAGREDEDVGSDLSSFLAGLKAKYGIREGTAADCTASGHITLGTPNLGSPASTAGSALPGPPAALAVRSADSTGAAGPPDTQALQEAAAAAGAPLTAVVSYQGVARGDAQREEDGDADDDLEQLLQLEALEEQLARQLDNADASTGLPCPAGSSTAPCPEASSIPCLTPATTTSSGSPWLEEPASQTHGGSEAGLGWTWDGTGVHDSAERLPWGALSQELVREGFPAITLSEGNDPNPAATFAAVSSLLAEYNRRSQHARQLADAAQNAALREELGGRRFQAALREKETEIQKWRRLALQSQRGLRDAQQSERAAQRAAHAASADCVQLQDRLAQLEHDLRAKSAEADRLQQRFASHLDKEDRRAKADKAAHERLKRAYAASRGASSSKAGAAFVTNAAMEMRPVDIVRVYEEEKAKLQEEVAIIRAENRVLEGQLQRAKERLERSGCAAGADEGLKEERQARAMARNSAAMEERAARLEEENGLLLQELGQRPTHGQYASLQRQVDIMARQLSALAAQKAAASAKPKGSDEPKPKQLSTREAIQRDKSVARLGLHAVEQLPKPVLVEIAQDACIMLECSDALKLCEAIEPVQETAALVPRLQCFVDEVSWVVFKKGLAHVPEQWRQDSPADVPAILGRWVEELGELIDARGTMRALLRVLGGRAGLKPNQPPPAASDVVGLVGSLVELERAALHSQEVIQAAEAVLAAQPGVLVHRIVRQFQELFRCRGLEGVMPCMNKLYLAHTEAQTFLKSLRAELGLDAGASLEACANRVAQLLEGKRELLGATLDNPQWHKPGGGSWPGDGAAESGGGGDRGVVVIERPRRAKLQRAAEVAIDRMAAKRNFPVVEIFVPARRQPLAEQAPNGGQAGGHGSPV